MSFFAPAATELFEVTAESFSSFLAKSEIRVLEFYAPWCRHCADFEGTFRLIDRTLAPHNVVVGRCDTATNSALAARFQINQIPTIFLLRGSSVWLYQDSLSHDKIVEFVINKFTDRSPMPFWESPMGPLGMFRGLLISVGMGLFNLPGTIRTQLGVSGTISLILAGLLAGSLAIMVATAFVYTTLPREKAD
jgi:thiol-disulfide isomerase/thioredoxin